MGLSSNVASRGYSLVVVRGLLLAGPGDSEGQGSLVCCSPRGHKESDTTEQLYNNKKMRKLNSEVKQEVQSHIAQKWQSQNLN